MRIKGIDLLFSTIQLNLAALKSVSTQFKFVESLHVFKVWILQYETHISDYAVCRPTISDQT